MKLNVSQGKTGEIPRFLGGVAVCTEIWYYLVLL